ncbi:MAG: Mrp/NBP35 family ATP-binding protein [Zavarzinella sp.]
MSNEPARNPAIQDVKHIIAVASGKGGVGKSTVSLNLAIALQQQGLKVGLMDADIYGPSVPMMTGTGAVDPAIANFPLEKHGLKLMSLGFLPDAGRGVLLRGPMVGKWVTSFLTQIPWGELDYLVIDMPPGTGDAQLSLCQTVPVTGAVIVTTPQDVSLIDAVKALNMFRQLHTPVLGVVENMSFFVGDDGKRYELFKHGGGAKLAKDNDTRFLAEIPIQPQVAECGDAGVPMLLTHPDAAVSQAYLALARALIEEVSGTTPQPLPEVEL